MILLNKDEIHAVTGGFGAGVVPALIAGGVITGLILTPFYIMGAGMRPLNTNDYMVAGGFISLGCLAGSAIGFLTELVMV